MAIEITGTLWEGAIGRPPMTGDRASNSTCCRKTLSDPESSS